MMSTWWKKLQYPYWYMHAIIGVLWQAAKEYKR